MLARAKSVCLMKTSSHLTACLSSVLLLWILGLTTADATGLCDSQAGAKPYLNMITKEGAIEIELFERAAPQTISKLKALVTGPIFNPALTGGGEGASVGYYDGLKFEQTKAHIQITTSERPAGKAFRMESEIDADALGLGERKIGSVGEAMDVWQFELLKPYYLKSKKKELNPKFKQWLDTWHATQSIDFLVGVSYKEVNEAKGYVYTTGLDSKPVKRGSVILKSDSPRYVTPRIGIILQDIPEETGKWMVIGQVVNGLDLAEQISLRPLTTPSYEKPSYIARDPVEIESVKFECRGG